jgi:hypothetical protein
MLRVSGAVIDSVRSFHPHVIVRKESDTSWRIVIAGSLASGSIGDLWVPNTRAADDYGIEVLEVAARNTFAQRADLTAYQVTLRRP